jgi:hypothetical protein
VRRLQSNETGLMVAKLVGILAVLQNHIYNTSAEPEIWCILELAFIIAVVSINPSVNSTFS